MEKYVPRLPKMVKQLQLRLSINYHFQFSGNLSDTSDKIAKLHTENHDIIIDLSPYMDANRITGKGYGESKLVNRCGNNVKCSEEEHQQKKPYISVRL